LGSCRSVRKARGSRFSADTALRQAWHGRTAAEGRAAAPTRCKSRWPLRISCGVDNERAVLGCEMEGAAERPFGGCDVRSARSSSRTSNKVAASWSVLGCRTSSDGTSSPPRRRPLGSNACRVADAQWSAPHLARRPPGSQSRTAQAGSRFQLAEERGIVRGHQAGEPAALRAVIGRIGGHKRHLGRGAVF